MSQGSRTREAPDSQLHTPQARQDSNLQPPVLETGALPLELRTSASARERRTGVYQGG